MRTQNKTPTANPSTFIYERFCAARELAGFRPVAFAREVGVSDRYLTYLARNERRASDKVLERLRELLGDNGFKFATGQAQSLRGR